MDAGAGVSLIKNKCLLPNVKKARVQKQASFHLLNGTHKMKGIAVLQHHDKYFEIYSAPNTLPIEADGILGNDFLKKFNFHQVDIINNKLISDKETLPLNENPIVIRNHKQRKST